MDQFKEPEKVASAPSLPSDAESVQPAGPASTVNELALGDVVAGRYKILSLLGRGGVGSVYKVEQILLKKQYALKTLLSVAASDVAWRRFQKEAQAASRLEHPNLARAVDFGMMDGNQPFLVMDLVEGQTLAEYLRLQTTLTVEAALLIFIPICFALAYAHKEGVIHRDIKPSNIVLVPSDTGESQHVPKIVDFGIAKLEVAEEQALTKTGEIFGTPLYMSPEQCAGLAVDNRSDIYSLGCVLFESLTGAPPFRGPAALETMMKHINESPLSLKEASIGLHFPLGMEGVVAKMLAKEPDNRYSSCLKLAEDLILLQKGKVVSTAGVSSPTSMVPSIRSSNPRLILISVVGALAVFLTLFSFHSKQQEPMLTQQELTLSQRPNTKYNDSGATILGAVDTYFCKSDSANGRVFRFGERITDPDYTYGSVIGYARRLPDGRLDSATKLAKGDIRVPPASMVVFQPSIVFSVEHPNLFRCFKPGDIQKLTFNVNEILEVDSVSFNAGMAYAGLKNLNELCFNNVPLNADGLTNLKLDSMQDLNTLGLIDTHVDGNDLGRFTILRQLKTLEFSSSQNASALLKVLKGLWHVSSGGSHSKEIRQLLMRHDQLTDNDLSAIGECDLTYLTISDNPALTNAGLKHLLKQKRLVCLCLDGRQFDRSVLQLVASKIHLTDLLTGPVNWTTIEKEQFRRSLPNCKIDFADASR